MRRDNAGTRTSNPTAESVGPSTVMKAQASSWLRATCPRWRMPARSIAGKSRPRRSHSAVIGRLPRSVRSAASTGMSLPWLMRANTVTSHTPPVSGAASCNTSRVRVVAVTVRDHCSSRFDTSVASVRGARNAVPSMRAMTASARSAGVPADGGAAGRFAVIRSTAWATIASTTAAMIEVAVARPAAELAAAPAFAFAFPPLTPPAAVTGAGIEAASASTAGLSTSAGSHRTPASTSRPSGAPSTRRPGTTEP